MKIIVIALLLAILYCIVAYLTNGKRYAASAYVSLVTVLAIIAYLL